MCHIYIIHLVHQSSTSKEVTAIYLIQLGWNPQSTAVYLRAAVWAEPVLIKLLWLKHKFVLDMMKTYIPDLSTMSPAYFKT